MNRYGAAFDRAADRWKAIEDEHDRIHPNRDECGGVGGCTMMRVAVDLEQQMLAELETWRREN
jgi:hypothetical protein